MKHAEGKCGEGKCGASSLGHSGKKTGGTKDGSETGIGKNQRYPDTSPDMDATKNRTYNRPGKSKY